MLTFEMKSNWVVNNKSRFIKVEKAIEALEAKVEQLFARRKCVNNDFHKSVEKFVGTPEEYHSMCYKHEEEIRKINADIDVSKCQLKRLDHVAIKLLHHERFIFALPHTW